MNDLEFRMIETVNREPRVLGRLSADPDISIFRSRDYVAIRALCTHPRIFSQINDDFTADPKTWQPPRDETIVYLLAADKDGPCGFGIFHPRNRTCWEGHFGFLPRVFGADARKSLERMFRWMWQNTSAQRIVGEIVRENKLAIRFARSVGCEIYGINKASKLRGGVLVDQVCLGISKG